MKFLDIASGVSLLIISVFLFAVYFLYSCVYVVVYAPVYLVRKWRDKKYDI